MNGAIDEVKILDCALSSSEVNDLMNEPLQPSNIEQSNSIENNFDVFPNPTNSSVNFTTRETDINEFTLRVFDINGKLILEENAFGSNYTLNLGKYSEGIYQYRIIINDNIIESGKIVKVKD